MDRVITCYNYLEYIIMNYFNTLNESLESEGLLELTPLITGGIQRGETYQFTIDDGTRWGHFVSIYRDERGMYERPVHYSRG